jgi:hypothetical protein
VTTPSHHTNKKDDVEEGEPPVYRMPAANKFPDSVEVCRAFQLLLALLPRYTKGITG